MYNQLAWFVFSLFCYTSSIFASVVTEVSIMHIGKIRMDETRHIPLIETKIAGFDTSVLLDTGSHPAIFTEYFAKKIGLIFPKDNGKNKPFIFFEKQNVSLQLGPITSSLNSFAVIQQRDDFYKKNNIGAIYNPALLKCENCLIVLDFINGELYAAQTERVEDLPIALDRRYPGLIRISATYVADDSGMLHVSGVSANGQAPVVALLDTGANMSRFAQASIGDAKIAGTVHSMDGVGKIRDAQETTAIPVAINDRVISTLPIAVEKSLDGTVTNGPKDDLPVRHAEIGMDIMKNCAVAIEHNKAVHFYCKPHT